MQNNSGQWLNWDGSENSLVAKEKKTLDAIEQIAISSDKADVLPVGEYLLYAGYRDKNGDVNYNEQSLSFMISDSNNAALHRIVNNEFLDNYLLYIQDYTNTPIYVVNDMVVATAISSSPESGATASSSTSSNNTIKEINFSSSSQTNLQEAGVDEADKIKTYQDMLYVLEQCGASKSDNNILPPSSGAPPLTELELIDVSTSTSSILPYYPQTSSNTCLTTYKMDEQAATTQQLSQLTLDSSYSSADGQLILNSTNNIADRLVWLSTSFNKDMWASWSYPYYWNEQSTQLQFFDLSNLGQPQLLSKTTLDGALISSRRIGDRLYLVSRKNQSYNATTKALPELTPNDQTSISLVDAKNCYIPASLSQQNFDGTIITITSMSIKNPDDFFSSCIVGNIETVYVSLESLYVATSRYPYTVLENAMIYDYVPEYETDIHKFSLQTDQFSYKGSISIPGHLGWDADKKSFRFGENNGVLKVASSIGETWTNNSRTRVSVIKENTNSNTLEEISFLDNLGKPGEKLYAARFIGNKGYLVTFKITDPLILLDFSVPESPVIQGELEISGYSDYLHPINDNYLLGIGKEAIADSSNDPFNDGGAWYQGLKLSLFDISSGSNLKTINSVVIGNRGTQSAVLSDHHALAWLAADDGENFRLVIPIDENTTKNQWNYYNTPSAYYDWTQTGAYVFDINTNNSSPSLALTGSFITESLNLKQQQVYSNIERVVLQGSTLHYVHNNQVYSSLISELTP